MSLKNKQCLLFHKMNGFTLLEVLITLVVMSIGLLGVAALQISSLRNNQSSEFRGQATELARSMSDRMRSNTHYVQTNDGGNYISIAPTSATIKASCSSSPGCANSTMAENDLFEWNQYIQAVLPGGIGSITRNGSASLAVYTISVQWLDASGSERALNAGFAMEFQP